MAKAKVKVKDYTSPEAIDERLRAIEARLGIGPGGPGFDGAQTAEADEAATTEGGE